MNNKTPTKRKKSTPATTPAPLGMDAFKTRSRANEGQRVELHTPEGNLSPHFLIVRGIDSDEFQKAKAKQARVIAELAAMPEGEREEKALDATCDLLAVLVKDWSFSNPDLMPAGEVYPCNLANVAQFLREAPQIREKVDEMVSRRTVFFRMQSGGLKITPADSSH
jgi:hypothetical protein